MRIGLEHVGKTYANGTPAVWDLTFEVADGELVTLVGPSGCGKTTTLRMIAGLESATEGSIRLGQRVVDRIAPRDRNVAMVFQNPALYPHMSVYRNLGFPLRLRGFSRAETEDKIRHTAALLGIAHLLDRRPGQLSGGERQRVALGRAMVRDPACFLFDEPLSSLDAALRTEMRGELQRLHQELQTATLHVTHDQEEAMALGSRVIVMRDGRLEQIGRPLEIYEHPANRFVASFFGSPAMNFVEGVLRAANGGLWFETPGWQLPLPASLAGRLARRVDAPVVLGIRPEDILEAPSCDKCAGLVKAEVVTVERLGDKAHVRLSIPGGVPLVANLSPRTVLAPGDRARLEIVPERMHFFEPDDATGRPGVSLCSPQPATAALPRR
jgi:ABC-type sugar transport system ATPase subunit